MPANPKVTLHYFDARGRAQFIRYYLSARGVSYDDERFPLTPGFAEWAASKADREKFGPFHKLPVLRWGERKVAETMVIQAFLHRALGDEVLLSEEENLQHAMLTSSLYNDVMVPIATLLWAEIAYAGVDVGMLVKRTHDRLRGVLAAVNATLDEWAWLARAAERPVMLADCMLWEELDVVRHVFGEGLALDEYPTLASVHRSCAGRATFETICARVVPVTGRGLPAEDVTIRKLRELVAAA